MSGSFTSLLGQLSVNRESRLAEERTAETFRPTFAPHSASVFVLVVLTNALQHLLSRKRIVQSLGELATIPHKQLLVWQDGFRRVKVNVSLQTHRAEKGPVKNFRLRLDFWRSFTLYWQAMRFCDSDE